MNSLESLVTSFDSLWSNYFAIKNLGANKMHNMKFNNVVNKTLVTGPEEQKILDNMVLFPEHRVFTIIVGKLERSWSERSLTRPSRASTSTSRWHCRVLRSSNNTLFCSSDHKDSKNKAHHIFLLSWTNQVGSGGFLRSFMKPRTWTVGPKYIKSIF